MAVTESSNKTDPIVHASLAEALAAFQGECPPVRKTSKANISGKSRDGSPVSYTYDFADLSTIHEVIDPIKGKHGLSFVAWPTDEDGSFVLRYRLAHTSGDSIDGVWPLDDPRRMSPQDVGKLLTYYRRYAECAVLGIAPGGDDDGGENAPKIKAQPAPVDWGAVIDRAREAVDLPALRRLYVQARVKSAPEGVQAAFQSIVNEWQQPAHDEWQERDDNPLHQTPEELAEQAEQENDDA